MEHINYLFKPQIHGKNVRIHLYVLTLMPVPEFNHTKMLFSHHTFWGRKTDTSTKEIATEFREIVIAGIKMILC